MGLFGLTGSFAGRVRLLERPRDKRGFGRSQTTTAQLLDAGPLNSPVQNGLTTTMITMIAISTAGTSLTIL